MEGYKFDLRVYILVTSCDPLKVFLYHDGLVRMGTEKYHPPSDSNLVSGCSFHLLHIYVEFHLCNIWRRKNKMVTKICI